MLIVHTGTFDQSKTFRVDAENFVRLSEGEYEFRKQGNFVSLYRFVIAIEKSKE